MPINPRDYDLTHLREMADGPDGDRPDGADRHGQPDPLDAIPNAPESESFRASLYRELMPISRDDTTKPYLSGMPEVQSAEFLIFEWLEYLLLHGGYRGAMEALAYYEDVEWITGSVRSELGEYLMGIDHPAHDGEGLDVDDHLLSLVYVVKLDAMS
ncbi:FlaD/FlaE family flagellar protein [Halococcoides cellulosivorans]|uniref:Flagella E n=1 Tax=Halococcoides cellulosivorans TaxID=1679096 RepID=A0A2R4WYQ3_9EURY|nr:FlaD/FlaE family flagellar protein [Halococcoides cellulosivorans]AWB26679.1 flagella E [Halococcoides cellulosivorans]